LLCHIENDCDCIPLPQGLAKIRTPDRETDGRANR